MLDTWRWTIDASSTFTMKSIIDDLTGSLELSERDFYYVIWLDYFQKKVKIFLWELSHNAINTPASHALYVPFSILVYYMLCSCWALCSSFYSLSFCWAILEAFGDGLLLLRTIFMTYLTHLWWATRFLVARRLFGLLFFGLSVGLFGVSVIGVSFKIIFPLYFIFWHCVFSTVFFLVQNWAPF